MNGEFKRFLGSTTFLIFCLLLGCLLTGTKACGW